MTPLPTDPSGTHDEQSTGRRPHPRLHACPVRADLHAAARLVRRRRDQGREGRRGRRHARPAARHPRCRQPLLHDAQPQQALDHGQHQGPEGQGSRRPADQVVRRAGRELRARRARPHGLHLGAHPFAQPAHDRRLGEGLRPGAVRGLQGLRERRPVRRRLGVDDRLRRRPAAGHRRADRRLRHRAAPRARHRRRALPAQHDGQGPEGARRDAGRRAQPLPRQAARPAAPRAHRRDDGIPAVPRRRLRRRGAARRQCLGRRPAGLDPEVQGLADTTRTPTSTSSPRRRCGARSAR